MSQALTQELLMAVQLSFNADEHEKSILKLAARNHPTQLAEQFQQSREPLKQIKSVSTEEQRHACREEATTAGIIRQAINKVPDMVAIDEEQPLSQARGNVTRLEEQLKEAAHQLESIAADATKEALEKLRTEQLQLSHQVLTSEGLGLHS